MTTEIRNIWSSILKTRDRASLREGFGSANHYEYMLLNNFPTVCFPQFCQCNKINHMWTNAKTQKPESTRIYISLCKHALIHLYTSNWSLKCSFNEIILVCVIYEYIPISYENWQQNQQTNAWIRILGSVLFGLY